MRELTPITLKQRERFFRKLEGLEKFIKKGETRKIIYPSVFLAVVFMLIIIFFIPILLETSFFWKIIIYIFIFIVVFALFDGVIFRPIWRKKITERMSLICRRKAQISDMLKNAKNRLKLLKQINDIPGIKDCENEINVLKRTKNPLY